MPELFVLLSDDSSYTVIPRWATAALPLPDLFRHLAHPLDSGLLGTEYDWEKLGYDLTPPELEFHFPQLGEGGIIVDRRAPQGGTLWQVALSRFGELASPGGMLEAIGKLPAVGFFAPGRVADAVMSCQCAPVHVSSAEETVYWLACLKRGRRRADVEAQLVGGVKAFGLVVRTDTSQDVGWKAEVQKAADPALDGIWFSVKGGGPTIGWNLAVALHVLLNNCDRVGGSLKRLQLVAQLDVPFRPRRFSEMDVL